jgi:hypothetical protein
MAPAVTFLDRSNCKPIWFCNCHSRTPALQAVCESHKGPQVARVRTRVDCLRILCYTARLDLLPSLVASENYGGVARHRRCVAYRNTVSVAGKKAAVVRDWMHIQASVYAHEAGTQSLNEA